MKSTINEIIGISGLKITQKVDYIAKYLLNLSKYPSERESIVLNIKKPLKTQSEEVVNGVLGYMVYSIKTGQTSERLMNEIFKETRVNLKQNSPKMVNYSHYLNK